MVNIPLEVREKITRAPAEDTPFGRAFLEIPGAKMTTQQDSVVVTLPEAMAEKLHTMSPDKRKEIFGNDHPALSVSDDCKTLTLERGSPEMLDPVGWHNMAMKLAKETGLVPSNSTSPSPLLQRNGQDVNQR